MGPVFAVAAPALAVSSPSWAWLVGSDAGLTGAGSAGVEAAVHQWSGVQRQRGGIDDGLVGAAD